MAIDKAVVGLGNPGRKYAHTRHNVGFMAVDRYLTEFAPSARSVRCPHADVVQTDAAVIAKPTTYMNHSGHAVLELMERFQILAEGCLIVYDDVDLPFGKLRARPRGGPGSHNGIASVIEWANTKDFPRLRLGIASEPMPTDLVAFVLSPFTSAERDHLDEVLDRAAEAIDAFVSADIDAVMNRFNG